MNKPFLLLAASLWVGCAAPDEKEARDFSADSTELGRMVGEREQAMKSRDIEVVMAPFDTAATFVNGGGYWYKGASSIRAFHDAMFRNDSLTYTYKAGNVTIEQIRPRVAVLYYPWQQQWTLKSGASDTLNETGLMTIVAVKKGGAWKWRSITNQRTKEFFGDLEKHTAPALQ
ncbi:MAG: nuclear transport factor 2 family protein [Chitinophagaceae bacterium]|nr:MAG: nuclear transport factor 2 family protein [Chitinophagaceae bacterium]